MSTSNWILTARCPSQLGTVDVVTGHLYQNKHYIEELHSFDDRNSQQFFIRAKFRTDAEFNETKFKQAFTLRAKPFSMQWSLTSESYKPKVVILVSKFDHCLNDLLYKYKIGQLNIEITAIISNHPDLMSLADWYKIPFHHLPISKETKELQENEMWKIIQQTNSELVILARYMQVLSASMCQKLEGWAINIHHSLLPGVKGAKPYHQAYDKGVKTVGATAHYINNDLDEGPIIAQGIETVDHNDYPEDLIAKGRDIESRTLFKAVKYHTEKRVFLNNNRTIVFTN